MTAPSPAMHSRCYDMQGGLVMSCTRSTHTYILDRLGCWSRRMLQRPDTDPSVMAHHKRRSVSSYPTAMGFKDRHRTHHRPRSRTSAAWLTRAPLVNFGSIPCSAEALPVRRLPSEVHESATDLRVSRKAGSTYHSFSLKTQDEGCHDAGQASFDVVLPSVGIKG